MEQYMVLMEITEVAQLGINNGKIEFCEVNVNVFGYGDYQGGVVGINTGIINHCRSYKNVVCTLYAGGICGSNQKGHIINCGNEAKEVAAITKYAGGICGFSGSSSISDYTIEYCYNLGIITSDYYTGGICGAAWEDENKIIGIRGCYNKGEVKPYINPDISGNGGILGGTYFDYSGKKVKNINKIITCYNVGKTPNIKQGKINQIVSNYSDVISCYYINGRKNDSGYGSPKEEILFKQPISNTNSIIYLLEKENSGLWGIDSNYNNGYLYLLWQFKQFYISYRVKIKLFKSIVRLLLLWYNTYVYNLIMMEEI